MTGQSINLAIFKKNFQSCSTRRFISSKITAPNSDSLSFFILFIHQFNQNFTAFYRCGYPTRSALVTMTSFYHHAKIREYVIMRDFQKFCEPPCCRKFNVDRMFRKTHRDASIDNEEYLKRCALLVYFTSPKSTNISALSIEAPAAPRIVLWPISVYLMPVTTSLRTLPTVTLIPL